VTTPRPPRRSRVDPEDRILRRRRPSGEPAPIPRKPLAGSGKVWLAVAVVVVAAQALVIAPTTAIPIAGGEWWDRLDQRIIDWVVEIRTGLRTNLALAFDALHNEWFIRFLRWGTIAALIVFKRWRHLGVFVGCILVVQLTAIALSNQLARARPDGIEILTDWSGFSQPSFPMVAVAVTAIGMAHTLVVSGRRRTWTLMAVAALITLISLSRLYLGVDRLTDVLSGAVLGAVSAMLAFRIWTPDGVFPVSYRRAKTAHLSIDEDHKRSILGALRDQIGVDAVDLELFGIEGSGGSTPLRVRLAGTDPQYVFAKLYAQSHLRSDRWYKLGRRLLYGALEDEIPFRSVRKLAEREDYLQHLMVEAGVPGPRPLGVVEITPGREYLTVAEFVPRTEEISRAEVDTRVVHAGLRAIRAMWDSGLAHRDIKPANVLVRDGDVFIIDVAFGEVRPTPWRQAVDLANMMLTLSLRHPAEAVHEAALDYFTAADIAEACAATRGVTMPGELRAHLKAADRDLLAVHRALAPDHKPIRIQRWTLRRIGALVGSATLAVAAIWLLVQNIALVGRFV
jgi:tRNA A-37 threonylcarbamoyl transferase component Bud32/membrane-associated phospholipid phosphatase